MSTLQKINLGTPPTAVDGDTSRTANTKANANVDVLSSQVALTNAGAPITAAQALTAAAHIGKRVNIALTAAGVINMPTASTCQADQVTLLRNTGTTVATLAVTTGSGDTCALSKLNPGETALMDTDGVHAWTVLMRGRTNSDNETVNGNLAVAGNEAVTGNVTVGGTLGATGLTTLAGGASFGSSGQATISAAGAYSGVGAAYSADVSIGGKLGVTGQATFTLRPTFATKTPWDNGNLPSPLTTGGGNITGTLVQQGVLYTVQQTGNIGAGFAGWNATPSYAAMQIDSTTAGAVYQGIRWTRWGARHLAAIGCYEGGVGGIPSICMTLDPATSPQFFFYGNGNATFSGALTQNSDHRIKSEIVYLDPSEVAQGLRKSRPIEYQDNRDSSGRRRAGFIAHEEADAFPLLVVGEKDEMEEVEVAVGDTTPYAPGTEPDGYSPPTREIRKTPKLQSVDYVAKVVYLTAGWHEHDSRIAALEATLKALLESKAAP